MGGRAPQVTSQGGMDAAREAPFVYAALDALAARAQRWALHRAEALQASGTLAAVEGAGAVPDALAAAAEASVKQVRGVATAVGWGLADCCGGAR